MLAIVFAIGWPIWPLIIASVVALALIIERSIALRRARILPTGLLPDVLALVNRQQLTPDVVDKLEANSALGRVLSATLRGAPTRRDLAIQQAETAGSLVANQLSRYLTLLGSIGSIAPLLGLLGTVVGMIEIFASQQGGSDPAQLAHGISIALYCTAFGIIVAVPSVLSHRYFRRLVDDYLVEIEDQSQRLVETVYADRH
ncbi:MAG: MotA/TolQ/ExbB proton channel family protein [Burkholderiaceae bacterium]